MSPLGDPRPGWRIVLDAFLAARDHTLTNHELGDLRGVQAFRSRISDLRAMGCVITNGEYVAQGLYRYRLVSWPPALGSGSPSSSEAPKSEQATIAAHQDRVAERPDPPAPDALFDAPPAPPAPHYDF
jgi:hypothetical protein